MTVLHLQVLAGFGNRLRSLLSGICLAEEQQIKLQVYWNSRDRHCAIPFCSIFDLNTLPSFVSVSDGVLSQSTTCNSTEQKEEILKEWDGTSDLYLNSYGNFHIPDRAIWLSHLRRLKPVPELQRRIDEKIPPFVERLVGIHIRRTDNWKAMEVSPLEKFLERMDGRDNFFIVATDDGSIRQFLLDRYKGRILFPSTVLERHTREGMSDAMVDFFCLALCPLLLGSDYSSFNDLAAAYGGCELVKVI